MKPNRLGALLAALALLLLTATAAHAHRRPHRHHHHRHHTKAVIVVGQPKPLRTAVVINGVPHGVLDMNVKPRATEVWIDGKLRGTCDAFDGHPNKLHLRPGTHRIKLVTPDGVEVARDVRVKAGVEINVGLDLRS
jgi:hypothetical protein